MIPEKEYISISLDPDLKLSHPFFYDQFIHWWGKTLERRGKAEDVWGLPDFFIRSVQTPPSRFSTFDVSISAVNLNLNFETKVYEPQKGHYHLEDFDESELSQLIQLFYQVEFTKLKEEWKKNAKANLSKLSHVSTEEDHEFLAYLDSSTTLFDLNFSKLGEFASCFKRGKFLRERDLLMHPKGELYLLKARDLNYYLWLPTTKLREKDLPYLKMLLDNAKTILQRTQLLEVVLGRKITTQKRIDGIDFPLVLFSDNNLLIHNSRFSDLNLKPSECLSLQDSTLISIRDKNYAIKRQLIAPGIEVFLFLESQEDNSIINEELGIIASSLAHELNNPLAGMLAALTVLKMDMIEGDESMVIMNNIQNSLHRSKELVDTLLGFSRYHLNHQEKNGQPLSHYFNQAIHLIRFRLMEENLKVQLHIERGQNYQPAFNPSLMSMFFYLIISEYLTLVARNKMILEEEQVQTSLTVMEQSREIHVTCHSADGLMKALDQSKILGYMETMLSLTRKVMGRKIIFTNYK